MRNIKILQESTQLCGGKNEILQKNSRKSANGQCFNGYFGGDKKNLKMLPMGLPYLWQGPILEKILQILDFGTLIQIILNGQVAIYQHPPPSFPVYF